MRLLLACGIWVCGAGAARAAEVDLRVLVIAVGDAAADPGRAVAEQTLNRLGVPYEVLDTSRADLTDALLRSGARGRFNGIILTQSETVLPEGGTGFDRSEFALLYDYERSFGVREAVLSGFPATNPDLGVDYGMGMVSWGNNVLANWRSPAGGTELFEYVNTANPLPTESFTFLASSRGGESDPIVEPLLVSDDPNHGLLFRVTYPDGRKVLLSIINNATFFLHTDVLAYEFVNFATSGLFLGARHVYLSVHNDDVFLSNVLWDPDAHANSSEAVFRLPAATVPKLVSAQRQFRRKHPLARGLTIELAFNGAGAMEDEALTQAIQDNASSFSFINHTFTHLAMDRICDDAGNCPQTSLATARSELRKNADTWRELGLPGAQNALYAVVTGGHSGLSDGRGTADISDDVPFPQGLNPNFARAAAGLGVRVLGGDISRPNQDKIQRVPGYDLVLLPRYPTAVFFNTTTPAELESEYNYLFHEQYVERGQDPCSIAGAICTPRTYEEIVAADALTTLRHMLSFQPFPHYFHQTNLHIYDEELGRSLQFDWLEAALTAYERVLKLPVETPRYRELADLALQTLRAGEAKPSGYLDTTRNTVTLVARSSAQVEVTGLQGGTLRGGQRIRTVSLDRRARTFTVDPALTR